MQRNNSPYDWGLYLKSIWNLSLPKQKWGAQRDQKINGKDSSEYSLWMKLILINDQTEGDTRLQAVFTGLHAR